MADPADRSGDDDEGGSIGIFPSWGWLYATVIVYTMALVVVLYLFTVLLDHGGAP